MWLNPGGSDSNPDGTTNNYGPHCRNCHVGASNCQQCHDPATGSNYGWLQPGLPTLGEYKSTYQAQAYLHTSAVAGLNGQCIDGGFSWPHRTLGANLLKDELYGVNFDGSQAIVGGVRDLNSTDASAAWAANYAQSWFRSVLSETSNPTTANVVPWQESGQQIGTDNAGNVGAVVENLDSVCMDCHGDAKTWNGDNPAVYTRNGDGTNWELLLKGLP